MWHVHYTLRELLASLHFTSSTRQTRHSFLVPSSCGTPHRRHHFHRERDHRRHVSPPRLDLSAWSHLKTTARVLRDTLANMATKRPHAAMNASAEDEEPVDPSDELTFIALGGGNEVGRSCHIIEYKGKTVMLDAGIHPSYEGFNALPFYDEYDLSTVDLLLITQ